MPGLVSVRTKSLLNQLFVVGATLLLGSAVHVSVVTGAAEPASPAVVLRLVAGGLLAVGGWFTRVSREERVGDRRAGEADAEGSADEPAPGEQFDPEVSPLDQSDMENLDREDG